VDSRGQSPVLGAPRRRRHGVRPRPARRLDPLLVGIAGFGLGSCCWLLTGWAGLRLELVLVRPIMIVLDVATVVPALRIAGMPHLPGAKRRHWLMIGIALTVFALGDTVLAVQMIADPQPDRLSGGTFQGGFLAVGLILILLAMLLHPGVVRSGRERVRMMLDSGAVLVAGTALAWWLSVLLTRAGGDPVITAATAALLLVVVFAAIRLILSGAAPTSRAAVIPLATGAALQGLPPFLAPAPGATPSQAYLAMLVLPSVIVAFGPRIEQLRSRWSHGVPEPRRDQNPYRAVPYLAVVATFAILLVALPKGLGIDVWGVVVAAVLSTLIVVTRQLLVFRDNTELMRQAETVLGELRDRETELHRQATHDGLTGLWNRTAFVEHAEHVLHDPDRGHDVFIFLIDLDDFKQVNDTLGHAAGDRLLVEVAQRMRLVTREQDAVARLGGDEFAILFAGPQADGERLARRLLEEITRPCDVHGHSVTPRATVGLAAAASGEAFDEVLRHADVALYAAKDAGKNTYCRYAPTIAAGIEQTHTMASRLVDALDAGLLVAVYRPLVSLQDGAMLAARVLPGWRGQGPAHVVSEQFLMAAERTGVIVPLGEWLVRQACRQLAAWRADPRAAGLTLQLAVTRQQLRDPGLVGVVCATLAEVGLTADRLALELDPATLVDDAARPSLTTLADLGIRLVLRRFGETGAAIDLLTDHRLHGVTLAPSLLLAARSCHRREALACAVARLATQLGLTAIADGVDGADLAVLARRMGYQVGSGAGLGAPMRPDALLAWPGPSWDDELGPVPRPDAVVLD
jgi:diguanylate cyclase (GGDEF)-like protein